MISLWPFYIITVAAMAAMQHHTSGRVVTPYMFYPLDTVGSLVKILTLENVLNQQHACALYLMTNENNIINHFS